MGIIAGTGGITYGGGDVGSQLRPTDPIYQSYEDYWSLGASGTVGIGGLSADLHLVQLADFLTGFALMDLGRDDAATTQPIRLRGSERTLLQELAEIEQSPVMLADYTRRRPELQIPTMR
jgi:hypothetical protein